MASVRMIIEQMDKTDIGRSIVVYNIPPGTKEETLFIHFQRQKNGGGDVSSVNIVQNLCEDGVTAIVTFEQTESEL